MQSEQKPHEVSIKQIGEFFITSQTLGRGMCGEVKLARKGNEYYACKTISKKWLEKETFRKNDLKTEVKLLMKAAKSVES